MNLRYGDTASVVYYGARCYGPILVALTSSTLWRQDCDNTGGPTLLRFCIDSTRLVGDLKPVWFALLNPCCWTGGPHRYYLIGFQHTGCARLGDAGAPKVPGSLTLDNGNIVRCAQIHALSPCDHRRVSDAQRHSFCSEWLPRVEVHQRTVPGAPVTGRGLFSGASGKHRLLIHLLRAAHCGTCAQSRQAVSGHPE
jgi:hypothetical protein